MKQMIFAAALAAAAFAITGCVQTVTDENTFAPIMWNRDAVAGRYNRSVDQVYQASLYVIQHDGVLVTEYIPHDSTNDTRSLYGRVNETKVWVRVAAVDSHTAQIDVQARTKFGSADVDLAHELEKEVALQLSTH